MSIIFQHLVRDTDGVLQVDTTSPPVDAIGSQGLLINNAGAVFASEGPITRFYYGLPYDEFGAIVLENAEPAFYSQSLPFTASGAIACANDVAPTDFTQGIALNDGALAVSGFSGGGGGIYENQLVAYAASSPEGSLFFRMDTSPWEQVSPITDSTITTGLTCVYSKEANLFVLGASSPDFEVYDTTTWPFTKVQTISNALWACEGLAFSPDGAYLAVSTSNAPQRCRIYDVSDWSFFQTEKLQGKFCRYNFDGSLLVFAGTVAPYLMIYDTSVNPPTLEPLPADAPTAITYGVAFHPTQNVLALGVQTNPDNIMIYDMDLRTRIGVFTVNAPACTSLAFSPDGSKIAIVNNSNSDLNLDVFDCTDLYNPANWTQIPVTDPPTAQSFNSVCAWSPDSNFIFVGERMVAPSQVAFDASQNPIVRAPAFGIPATNWGRDAVVLPDITSLPPP